MRRALCLLVPVVLSSCNGSAIGFKAVSIREIYGWVDDSCKTVTISGHGFDDGVTATIGGNPVTNLTLPDRELDKGFLFTAGVPAATEAGYGDVVVTNGDGETSTITDGYYYVACPMSAWVDGLSPTDGITAGASVGVAGCQLEGATQVQVGTAEPVPLTTATCGTSQASFAAPDLIEGTYTVTLLDAEGALVFPPACTPDTADTGSSCITLTLTYGASQ